MTERSTNWAGVAFGVSLASLAAFQQFKLPPVLPLLLERYGYDRLVAGGFMSIYALVGLAASIAIGRWIERRGMTNALAWATAVMIAGNFVGLLLPQSAAAMLLGRGLEGVSFSIAAIIGPALAGASASPRHRSFAIALSSAWIPIGQIAAGLLAPLALHIDHWEWLWYAGILGTFAVYAWSRQLARDGTFGGGRGAGGGGAGGTNATNAGERRALLANAAIFMLWSCQYFAYMTWLPQYLVEARALGAIAAVFGYLLPVVVLLIFNLLTGEALRRGVPVAPLLAAGTALQALVWWLTPLSDDAGFGIALLIGYGVAAGVTPTCLFALPGIILGGPAGPRAFAGVMTGRNIGVFAGPILLAAAMQGSGGWAIAVPIFGAISTVCAGGAALLALRLGRPAPAARPG